MTRYNVNKINADTWFLGNMSLQTDKQIKAITIILETIEQRVGRHGIGVAERTKLQSDLAEIGWKHHLNVILFPRWCFGGMVPRGTFFGEMITQHDHFESKE